ncbi:hypothetical protein BaRGS_00004157 [Batillaria attramentaria]|uniref:FZ domain-containing protein n=1 Tax=Batillaria attramentaria TaxID=370345 RepID=A0ABD0LYX0_9CAEN
MLVPGRCQQFVPQQQLPPGFVPQQQLQPGQPQQQVFIRLPEFFCQGTPRVPNAASQAQCLGAFNAVNMQEFCVSVATFCTNLHLTMCPRQATAQACNTCLPLFQQACQQQG